MTAQYDERTKRLASEEKKRVELERSQVLSRGIPMTYQMFMRRFGHRFEAYVIDHFLHGQMSKGIVHDLACLGYSVHHMTSNQQRGDLCGFIAARHIRAFQHHMRKYYPQYAKSKLTPPNLQIRFPVFATCQNVELMPESPSIVWMSRKLIPSTATMVKEPEYACVPVDGEIDVSDIMDIVDAYKIDLHMGNHYSIPGRYHFVAKLYSEIEKLYMKHHSGQPIDMYVDYPVCLNIVNTHSYGGVHWVAVILL